MATPAVETRALVLLLGALASIGVCFLVMPVVARAQAIHAIAPGNDARVAAMLGAGVDLPGSCALGDVRIDRTVIVASFHCGAKSFALDLRHPSDPEADPAGPRTTRFAISYRRGFPAPLAADLRERIAREERDFRWTSVGAPRGSTLDAAHRDTSRLGAGFAGAEAFVAFLLLGLAVPALVLALRRVVASFVGKDDASARWLGAIVVVGAVVRLLAPLTLVTMYIGYLLTEQASEFQIDSHYGLGSQVLYHTIFRFLPVDHRVLMRANSIVGVIGIPLVAGLAARLASDRRVGLVLAAIVAFTPLFVKNDCSEANNVPVLVWLFGGLVLFEEYVATARRLALAGATALLAFAAVGRPEMPILVPFFCAAVVAASPAPRVARLVRDRRLGLAVLVALALVTPHVVHVAHSVTDLNARDGLAIEGSGSVLHALFAGLFRNDTVLTPSLFPLALVAFAVVACVAGAVTNDDEPGVLRSQRRRTLVALGALAVFALGLYGLDLCVANMARVHVPAALVVSWLAAIGVLRIVDAPSTVGKRGYVIAALVASAVVSAIPTGIRLWAPTNESAEEDFIESALAHLPKSRRFALVRIASTDVERASAQNDPTHRHFPDYLVRPPARNGRSVSIGDFLAEPEFSPPAFFYAGTRCYSRFRPEGVPPPRGDGLRGPCAEMKRRFVLEPVLERVVVNRGDVWLEYYGDAPTLRLGLYRIRGFAEDSR